MREKSQFYGEKNNKNVSEVKKAFESATVGCKKPLFWLAVAAAITTIEKCSLI